jgi:hypothetical protein
MLIFLLGVAWDGQWHRAVGRGRVLTAPHLMILGGIALAGLVSLVSVLVETWRARRRPGEDERDGARILGVLRAPIGTVVAGCGALLAGLAFPLDQYWHILYGIDVEIWKPFHVMIISAMGLAGLGAAYAAAAEMNRLPDGAARRRARALVAIALGLTATTFLLLIAPATGRPEGLARAGDYAFALYPVLLAFALPATLMSAALGAQRPGAATLTALTYTLVRQAMFALVPPAMDLLVAAEGLAYRPTAPQQVVWPSGMPGTLLAAAVVLDLVGWAARRRGGDGARAVGATGVLVAVALTVWDRPWAVSLPRFHPGLDVAAMHLNAAPLAVVAALLGVGLAMLVGRGLASASR